MISILDILSGKIWNQNNQNESSGSNLITLITGIIEKYQFKLVDAAIRSVWFNLQLNFN